MFRGFHVSPSSGGTYLRLMEKGRTTYLVELYLPASDPAKVESAITRAGKAAAELARRGAELRFVRSTYVAQDETCFLVYEAASSDLVRRACRSAGLPADHVLAAVEAVGLEQRGAQ